MASAMASMPSFQPAIYMSNRLAGPAKSRCDLAASTQKHLVADNSHRPQLSLAMGAMAIPHPEKVLKGGEDAYITSNNNGGFLAIADGVSGWADEGVDPALFSKEIIGHLAEALQDKEPETDLRLLLGKAHAATHSKGAATVILALLERRGILHVGSLGDCGLRIIRNGQIVFATKPQAHFFDCPFQFSSEINGQTADDALVYDLEVMEGDAIVAGSDGLFDNVYDHEIVTVVNLLGSGKDQDAANRTATALAVLASKNSKDPKYESPYSREAINQGFEPPFWKKLIGMKLTGGKLDDITVIVAHVVATQSSELENHTTLEHDILEGDMDSLVEDKETYLSSTEHIVTVALEGSGEVRDCIGEGKEVDAIRRQQTS